jgi:predicted RNA-binding Zn-ribbon protein involved in translation (DUF1610 family)
MTAEPIRCKSCGAAVPLLAPTSFDCPHCGAHVPVSADYKAVFESNVLEAKAHRELEREFSRVARVPSRSFDFFAIALVMLAPAIIAAAWMNGAAHPPSAIDLFTRAIIPALLPGTALWMWSAAIHATVVRFRFALAARAPKDKKAPPCCRNCGAPLAVTDKAIFARCAYCGSDSLVAQLSDALTALDQALRDELKTMAEAVQALVYRRRIVIGGIAIVLGVLTLLVVLLHATA